MRVEVLVSTMNQTDHSLIEKMRISTDAVVVNQCQEDSVVEYDYNGNRIKWINSTTRGLSVSRNICLREASGDICLLADDDLEYVNNYEQLVQNTFETHQNADIIRFRIEGIEEKFKTYPESEQKIGFLKSLKTSSVEIAFKKESLKGIRFDELIGAGTKYCMGEENALLAHCIKRKLKLIYVPITLSRLHIGESSWKNISEEKYLISRGAAFEAMDTSFTQLLILQFAFRKHKMFTLSIIEQVKLMEKGRSDYLNDRKVIRIC